MTLESAEKFFEKVKTDQSFFNSIQSAAPEERAKIISGAGFDFTNNELQKVIDEVSDAELAGVVGGQWKSGSNENKLAESNEMRIPAKMNNAGDVRKAMLKPE